MLQAVLQVKWKVEGSSIITAELVEGKPRVVIENVIPSLGEYVVQRHNMNILRMKIVPAFEHQMA